MSVEESNLVTYARDELQRAGMFDKDADYGGAIADQVMEIVEIFSKQGHSGFSAEYTLEVAEKLLRFQPLTPLTNNPDEWIDRSDMSGEPMWQSKRSPSVFSRDGGQNWYDLNDNDKK